MKMMLDDAPGAPATDAGGDALWPSPLRAWWVTGLLTIALFLSYVDRSVLALLNEPIKRSLQLGDTQMGLLQGATFGIVFTVTMLPFGWIADRLNRTRLIGVGIAVWSAMTAACGLAGSFTQIFVARMGVATGEGVLSPTGPALIGDQFPMERRNLALSLYGLAAGLGVAVSLIAGGMIAGFLGDREKVILPLVGALEPWQVIFICLGLPGLLVSLLFLATPDRRRRHPVTNGRPASFGDLMQVAMTHRAILLPHIAAYSLNSVYSFALQAWQPAFMMRVHGWDLAKVGVTTGLLHMSFSIVGAFLGGLTARWMWQRGRKDTNFRTSAIFVGLAPLPAIAGTLVSDGMTGAVLLAFSGMFTMASAGSFLAAVQEVVPPPMHARAAALYFIALGVVSMTMGPLVVGFMNQFVFTSPQGVGHSLAATAALVLPLGSALLFLAGRRMTALRSGA